MNPGILSDHAFIKVGIDFSNFVRGKGFYKFNNSLLMDEEYVKEVKHIIKRVTRQYSKLDYSDDFWNDLNSTFLQTIPIDISDQLFFDTLCMEIRGFSIQHASMKKKNE